MAFLSTTGKSSDVTEAYYAVDMSRQGFIWQDLASEYGVEDYSGNVHTLPAKALLQLGGDKIKRRPNAPRARSRYDITEKPYELAEYSFEQPVDDQIVKRYGNAIDWLAANTSICRSVIERQIESDVIAAVTNTTTFPVTTAESAFVPGSGRSFTANSIKATNAGDIVATAAKCSDAVQVKTGIKPDLAVIGTDVADLISQHPSALERVKHTRESTAMGRLNEELLAMILQVDRVRVASATFNAGKVGSNAATFRYLWPAGTMLLASTSSGSLRDRPQLIRTLTLNSEAGLDIETYTQRGDGQSPAEVVAATEHALPFVVDADAACLAAGLAA